MPTNLAIKYTGDTGMVEAKIGDLATINSLGGSVTFANTDPQYIGSATISPAIVQEDGTRVVTSNIVGNTLVNQFVRVRKIEINGGFVGVSGNGNVFTAPVITGVFINSGLCQIDTMDNLVFHPDDSTPFVFSGLQDVPTGRFYAECDLLLSTFSNWMIQIKGSQNLKINTSVVFYFDEVLPMTQYHEYLKKYQSGKFAGMM